MQRLPTTDTQKGCSSRSDQRAQQVLPRCALSSDDHLLHLAVAEAELLTDWILGDGLRGAIGASGRLLLNLGPSPLVDVAIDHWVRAADAVVLRIRRCHTHLDHGGVPM